MSRASLGGGAEEIKHNNKKHLRHHQVEKAEILVQVGAMGLNFSLSGAQWSGVLSCQIARPRTCVAPIMAFSPRA